MKSVTTREIKEAFVLADRMKNGPFNELGKFQENLQSQREQVQSLTVIQLDEKIARDSIRIKQYNSASWFRCRIKLADCLVWPRMGGRQWAEGTVEKVAIEFRRRKELEDKIWKMVAFANFFESALPIIVLQNQSIKIDDGSHRAVAMALANLSEAEAYLGKFPSAVGAPSL
jgi:hypothetical protein